MHLTCFFLVEKLLFLFTDAFGTGMKDALERRHRKLITVTGAKNSCVTWNATAKTGEGLKKRAGKY